ncbi:MAG: electron transport complex protein RnfA [Brevinema sp.]
MATASYPIIFIMAALSGNMVFARFLGLCPFFGVTKKPEDAIGMGFAVVVVQVLAVAITWPLYHFLLAPLGLGVLRTMLFILVIAALVQALEAFMKKSTPGLYKSLGIYLPLITTNCIVLAITLIVITEGLDYGRALWFAFSASLGFFLSLMLMSTAIGRIKNAPIPKAFQGAPIAFFIAALFAVAFLGFSGFSIQ